jgi:hypothetical protein
VVVVIEVVRLGVNKARNCERKRLKENDVDGIEKLLLGITTVGSSNATREP